MNDLPTSWAVVPLNELAALRMGKTILSKELSDAGIPVFSAGAENRPWGHVKSSDVVFERGTIVISARGTIGAPKLPEHDQYVSTQTTIAATPFETRLSRYLCSFLGVLDLSTYTSTTAIPMLTISKLGEAPVPIAPLAECERIGAKLDRLFAKTKRAREELDHIRRLIERYKRAIRAAAFFRDSDQDAQVPRSPVPLRELVTIRTGPFGSSLHKSDYVNGGVPVINPTHIVNGRITPSASIAITRAKAKELREFLLRASDVILGRRGIMGRCAVVSPNEDGFICGTGSMILRPGERLAPRFLQLFLSCPDVVSHLEEAAAGSTMINLNQSVLLELELYLPCMAEQQRLVHAVETANAWIDKITKEHEGASRLIDRLDQSILTRAFRGELVPQDPDDEPVAMLLERIRAERAKRPQRRGRAERRKPAGALANHRQ